MRHAIALTLLFATSAQPPALAAPAAIAPRPLASAFEAMDSRRWRDARRLAKRDGPVASAIIEWHRLRDGLGKPQEVVDFLRSHPDWPGLRLMRRQNELGLAKADAATILAFFEGSAPQTAHGALALARAHAETGDAEAARRTAVEAWTTLEMTRSERRALLARHGRDLAPHHAERLDMILWHGFDGVNDMLARVDGETRRIGRLRHRIARGAVTDPPAADRERPGVAHALFVRLMKRGHLLDAAKVAVRQSRAAGGLGRPDRWADRRLTLARLLMQDGKWRLAYDVASGHGTESGSSHAALEWLSGYLALRRLDRPRQAVGHFRRFEKAVATPISLGRAGYWRGRAHEALGERAAARAAYADGGRHQTSFYGLLAAERGGVAFDRALSAPQPAADWRRAAFASGELFEAASLAAAAGRPKVAKRFIAELASTLGKADLALLEAALAEIDRPHLQVIAGKAAAIEGVVIPSAYFPLHPMMELDLAVADELALSVARRESEFSHRAKSGAGARGLMQLMPRTAAAVAGSRGAGDRALSDWRSNAKVGAKYLRQLMRKYDGNIMLVAAAYNAGPRRVARWLRAYGDPRSGQVDPVDWVESLPYRETRNYVMRVAESLPVYRARLGKPPLPVPFSEMLTGPALLSMAAAPGAGARAQAAAA